MATYDLITSVTIGNTYTVTLSNIPQTFTDLHLRVLARSIETTNGYDEVLIRFNNNVNYYSGVQASTSMTAIFGSGANAAVSRIISNYASNPSNMFTPLEMYITNYASSSADNKMYQWSDGMWASGSSLTRMASGIGWYNSASALTAITVSCNSSNFDSYSQVQLYGIKSS